jgi:uncharacterized SAM-binding protein YcdF (DUF218 family)
MTWADALASLVWFVFSAAGLMLALWVAVAWLIVRPTSRMRRRLLIGIVVGFTLASLYCVPYGVSRMLVQGYHPFSAADVPAGRIAIVVLGAGEMGLQDWDRRTVPVIGPMEASRVLETARVYRLIPDAWVISSGGAVSSGPGAPTSAAGMRDALVFLGVPAARILMEPGSRSTRDEAVRIAPMVRSLNADGVILVTTDFHMRRSLGTFRAAGVPATPAIARDPYLSHGWRSWMLPTGQGLGLTGYVVHEFLAIGYYTVRGWLR